MGKKKKVADNVVAINKKANFDYFIQETLQAGIALLGWEVKSIRAGKVQLRDAYILSKHNELWLIGANITPLATTSMHLDADHSRRRKLLLKKKEIKKLEGIIAQDGMSLVPIKMLWSSKQLLKVIIGVAKGKKQFDKRQTIKERDWNRQKSSLNKISKF